MAQMKPAIDAASSWVVAHAAQVWGALLFGIVLALSWTTLRGIHTSQVRAVLHTLLPWPLTIAALITILNISIMGLYDVMAFRHTRTRAIERWQFGAVAFCWSNFLTLGPLAGPAIRFWLYRTRVDELSELHPGVVSVVIAFTFRAPSGLPAALASPSAAH